jgi:HK97 family phage prohead protease
MPERKGLVAFEFKAEQEGSFRATFSRFNVIDRDGDVTVPGAFERGQEVRIAQWGHNWGSPVIGKGAIDFDDERAWVDGEFFLDTTAGKDTYLAVKNLGTLQEWSYGFAIKERSFGEFGDPPQQVQFLRRLDVFEVSPVMIGAGIGTGTDAIKGATLADESEAVLTAVAGLSDRLKSLADLRAKEGRTLSTANRERLKAHRESLRAIADDLDALLAATAPDDGKGGDVDALLVEFAIIESRLNGVAA